MEAQGKALVLDLASLLYVAQHLADTSVELPVSGQVVPGWPRSCTGHGPGSLGSWSRVSHIAGSQGSDRLMGESCEAETWWVLFSTGSLLEMR